MTTFMVRTAFAVLAMLAVAAAIATGTLDLPMIE